MLALMEIFRHPSLEILPPDFTHARIAHAIGRHAGPTLQQKSCLWICSEHLTGTGFSCRFPVVLNWCERGQLLLRRHSSRSEYSWQTWATCIIGPERGEMFKEQLTGRGWQKLFRDPISLQKDLLVTEGCLPWHSLLVAVLVEKNLSTPSHLHSTCYLSLA